MDGGRTLDLPDRRWPSIGAFGGRVVGLVGIACLVLVASLWYVTRPNILTVEPGEDLAVVLSSLEDDDVIIELKSGEYYVRESLQLTEPLDLRGAGPSETNIMVTTQGTAFASSASPFSFSGATITRANTDSTRPLFHLTDSAIQLSAMQIKEPGGAGLLIDGASTGTVESVTVFSSDASGIVVGGSANIEMLSTESSQNGRFGFEWRDNAISTLEMCSARENGRSGFGPSGNAEIVGTNLLAFGNETHGFEWRENSTGTVSSSRSVLNDVHGFAVLDDAAVDLESNSATNSDVSGFYWGGRPKGVIALNEALESSRNGFVIDTPNSQLEFRGNESTGSGLAGFFWAQGGQVIAEANTSSGNGSGFVFSGNYELSMFKDNTSTANRGIGIHIDGQGVGVLLANTISDNVGDGIYLDSGVEVELRDNFVVRNGGYGIKSPFDDGSARNRNSIFENKLGDISS